MFEKKRSFSSLVALALIPLAMSMAAQAQTMSRAQVRVSIPFQFHVGNSTLPAGDYVVRQVNAASDMATLQLSSKDGKASAMINMIGASGSGESYRGRLQVRKAGA